MRICSALVVVAMNPGRVSLRSPRDLAAILCVLASLLVSNKDQSGEGSSPASYGIDPDGPYGPQPHPCQGMGPTWVPRKRVYFPVFARIRHRRSALMNSDRAGNAQ